eukprot:552735-Amphidinium_carterae.1
MYLVLGWHAGSLECGSTLVSTYQVRGDVDCIILCSASFGLGLRCNPGTEVFVLESNGSWAQNSNSISWYCAMDLYKVLQYPCADRSSIMGKIEGIIEREIRRHVEGDQIDDIIQKHHERICERTLSMKVARDTLEETVDLSFPSFDVLWTQLWHVSFKGKQNREKEVHSWAERDSLRKTENRAIVRASLTVTMTYMTETREMLTPMWEEIKEASTKKKAYHAWRALLFVTGLCPLLDEPSHAPADAQGSHSAAGSAKQGVATPKDGAVREKAMPVRKVRQPTAKVEEQMTCPTDSSDASDDESEDDEECEDEQTEQPEGLHDALKRKFGIFVKNPVSPISLI